jgi:twinkle protein
MAGKPELSERHARWIEDVRKIPAELAAEKGVVSVGQNLAFEYVRNAACVYRKVRAQQSDGSKTYFIEPKGAVLALWNVDCLIEPPPGVSLIVTEGELDALSVLSLGESCVVSVPNGAPAKPGEGDVDPDQDRAFAYLWDGSRLRPELDQFERIILMTDGDRAGLALREELSIRLGAKHCWFVRYPPSTKDANEVLVKLGSEALAGVIAAAMPMLPDKLVPFSEIPLEPDSGGYSTGWPELDRNLMLWPGTMTIVTGIPGSGKSQWMTALGANLARIHKLPGAILQFEDNVRRNRTDLLTYARSWSNPLLQAGIGMEPEAWLDRYFRTIAPSVNLEGDDINLEWLGDAVEEADA